MKNKKPRGKRKPRGYSAGDINKNLYVAHYEYVKGGNEIVSGESAQFFGDCKTFSDLMQFSLTEKPLSRISGGSMHRLKSAGINKPLMKFYRMKAARLNDLGQSLAWDICEHTLRAIQTGEDYFFRDLARLCKSENSKPATSLEYWLTILHWNLNRGTQAGRDQDYFFTAPELCKLAFLRGFKYTDAAEGKRVEIPVRRMHKICGKLGIKLLDGRIGESKSDFEMWRRKMQR